jgi:hypothetical protein
MEYFISFIEQARERMLVEFESWYGDGPSSVISTNANNNNRSTTANTITGYPISNNTVESNNSTAYLLDNEEKFDKAVQQRNAELKAQDPEAFAYFIALQSVNKNKSNAKTLSKFSPSK